MNRIFLPLLGFLILTGFTSSGQDKTLTLEDAVLKRWSDLRPETVSRLNWTKSEGQYCFSKTEKEKLFICSEMLGTIKRRNCSHSPILTP